VNYLQLWARHKSRIIPMSAFVAWLWAFPLFGILQGVLPVSEETLRSFNICFLAGNAASFLSLGILGNRRHLLTVFKISGAINFLLVLALLSYTLFLKPAALPGSSPLLWNIPVFSLAFLMGTFTAVYFTFWGSGISRVPSRSRGQYMGAMLAIAAFFTLGLYVIAFGSEIWAAVASGFLLLLPTFYAYRFAGHPLQYEGPLNRSNAQPPFSRFGSFWVPFALTLLSLYILSWVSHQVIFPAVSEHHALAPFLGLLAYGLLALIGGYFLDKLEDLEYLGIAGLVILGSAFFFLPVAAKYDLYLPLQLLLEGGYGLIDLFIWVCIAYAALFFKGDPVRYYGWGLFLNILFVLSGIVFHQFFQVLSSGYSTYQMSILAGAILFCGIFPALALRKIKPSHPSSLPAYRQIDTSPASLQCIGDDALTPREIEVLACILSGMDNASIESKLGVTKNTLKSHIKHIYNKMGVKKRSELFFKINNYKNQQM
jgi:DNA-binding CsgD family transcriptional regulator